MEKKSEISNIPQNKKRSLPKSTAKNSDRIHKEECRISSPKLSRRKLKSSIPRQYPKKSMCSKNYVKRNDDNIEKSYQDKENNLLNLIVKTVVKSTLEQLYGKESYKISKI